MYIITMYVDCDVLKLLIVKYFHSQWKVRNLLLQRTHALLTLMWYRVIPYENVSA